MKPNACGLLPAIALLLLLSGISAHAREPRARAQQGRPPREGAAARQAPAQSLPVTGSLESGQLQPSAPLATRPSEEEWRKQFPVKKTAGQ